MAEREVVTYHLEDRVGRVTLDRPPLHILDLPTIREYSAALSRVERDPAVVCILGAAGDKAFSAGVDIADHTREKAPAMLEQFHGLIRKVRRLECVTIAA
ncbi:MAG: enoyl-CoA hydratase/isomerase family protein, partial [Candidatus Eisenbacteria bacterium]